MKLGLFHRLAVVVCAASPAVVATGCGISTADLAEAPATSDEDAGAATLTSLEQGAATVQHLYLGAWQDFTLDAAPIVGTFDLVGGAQVEIRTATRDGLPMRFEIWQVHSGISWGKGPGSPADPAVTLFTTVDTPSGSALQALHADEDSSWLVRVLADHPEGIALRIDCTAGAASWGGACTPLLQPGQACPGSWQCDEGLACVVPGDTCEPTRAPEL
jgi:hypothetical protein